MIYLKNIFCLIILLNISALNFQICFAETISDNSQKIFKFGLMKNTFPEANPKDAQAAFEIWVKNYLKETQNKISVKIVSNVFEDIDSLIAALEKKEIEFKRFE